MDVLIYLEIGYVGVTTVVKQEKSSGLIAKSGNAVYQRITAVLLDRIQRTAALQQLRGEGSVVIATGGWFVL